MHAAGGRRAPSLCAPSSLPSSSFGGRRVAWRSVGRTSVAQKVVPQRRGSCWGPARAAAGPASNNAPALADVPGRQPDRRGGGPSGQQPQGGGGGGPPSSVKAVTNRVLRTLANLKLAIAELAGVAALSAVGTIIPQNQPYSFYVQNYPDTPGERVLGFVTHQLIWALQWDHIYTADYFYLLIALWASSLAACTATNQWPAVKVAQRWRFREDADAVARMEGAEELPNARLADLGTALAAKQYQVFMRNGSLYAFKGLAGKIGPIGVHASMLLALVGICMGLLGGFKGTTMIPAGTDLLLAEALQPNSALASYPPGAAAIVHVDDFRIDYRSDGSIRQFYTDVTVRDLEGRQLATRTLSVNQPLRYGGVTAYQTDWSMSALTLRAPGSPLQPADGSAFNLPMARLAGRAGDESKLYATFIPFEAPSEGAKPKGVSVLARDFQSVVFYDSNGEFVGVRRPGSGKSINVDGLEITVDAVVGGTGMELKHDPGVPFAYAGFGGMCLTTVVSYISHSQVWAVQRECGSVVVAGRTNRAKLMFQQELQQLLDDVPEVPPLPAAPPLK